MRYVGEIPEGEWDFRGQITDYRLQMGRTEEIPEMRNNREDLQYDPKTNMRMEISKDMGEEVKTRRSHHIA